MAANMGKKKGIIFGVAVNDADYSVDKYVDGVRVTCEIYRKWKSMLERCYSRPFLDKWPTYRGCKVCDEWLTFSNFKAWMEAQDWHGKHLDKDLLVTGNKVYSPETCCFIPEVVNSFLRDSESSRGDLPIGVSWHKKTGKYVAQCNNPFFKSSKHLGYFLDPELAHKAWASKKFEYACQLAEKISDKTIAKALVARYSIS